jgi:aldose 1-epimerase
LKVWDVVEATDTTATLALNLPDGEGGFPGNRRIEAQFEVTAQGAVRLTISTVSDALTLLNATNHSYWNLDGTDDFAGHLLQIAAENYLPATPDFIPTGEVRAVAGLFDFRTPQPISPQHPPLDNCFCLGLTQQPLRDVMVLQGRSGLRMTVATTEAGVQIYDCRHDGFKGLAIEAQGWPDAPNKPGFPSIDLPPGEHRVQVTEWRFAQD